VVKNLTGIEVKIINHLVDVGEGLVETITTTDLTAREALTTTLPEEAVAEVMAVTLIIANLTGNKTTIQLLQEAVVEVLLDHPIMIRTRTIL
jgi:hypothetical protein